MVFTAEEKLDIVRIYYNVRNLADTRNQYIRQFPNRIVPSKSTIHYTVQQFRERKTVNRKKRTLVRNEDQDLEVLLYFEGRFKEKNVMFQNNARIFF